MIVKGRERVSNMCDTLLLLLLARRRGRGRISCNLCANSDDLLLLLLLLGQKVSGAGMGNNLAGLTFYPSNESDPYITLKNMVTTR